MNEPPFPTTPIVVETPRWGVCFRVAGILSQMRRGVPASIPEVKGRAPLRTGNAIQIGLAFQEQFIAHNGRGRIDFIV